MKKFSIFKFFSFGKTNFDDADILMPLRQCCLIKPKTLSTLFGYYTADKGLSETLHEYDLNFLTIIKIF